MYCSKCGKQIEDGSRFCPECGAQFGAATHATPQPGNSAQGTRDQVKAADLVYPKNPPVSPKMAWLCVFWPGIPHLIHGQTAKGIVLMVVSSVSLIFFPITIAIIIASTIDAFKVGNVLRSGKPVGKWAWFPS